MAISPENPIPATFAERFLETLSGTYPFALLSPELQEQIAQRSSAKNQGNILQLVWKEVPLRSRQAAIAMTFPLPVCPASTLAARGRDDLARIPVDRLEDAGFVPVDATDSTLTVATPFPWLAPSIRQAASRAWTGGMRLQREPLVTYCTFESFARTLHDIRFKQGQSNASGGSSASNDEVTALVGKHIETPLLDLDDSSQPANEVLKPAFEYAIAAEATDIHISADLDAATMDNLLRVRIRVGKMQDFVLKTPRPGREWSTLIKKRLCILCRISETGNGAVADGKFLVRIRRTGMSTPSEIEVRLSVLENELGFHTSLRLLDKGKRLPDVAESFRYAPEAYRLVMRNAKEPDGILLCCGPTGQGKTTLLNAIMWSLNTGEWNIMTLEKPVEYRIPGVAQFDIGIIEKGLPDTDGWDVGFRGLLRKDLDIVLLGEIRERGVASLGVEAVVTGHQVYATVHTKSVTMIGDRLHSLGVNMLEFGQCLSVGLALRLIWRVCRQCSVVVTVDSLAAAEAWLTQKGLPLEWAEPMAAGKTTLREARTSCPCSVCNGRGYSGVVLAVEGFDFAHMDAQELIAGHPQGHPPALRYMQLMDSKHWPLLGVSGLRMIYDGVADLGSVLPQIGAGMVAREVERCNEAWRKKEAPLWKWETY